MKYSIKVNQLHIAHVDYKLDGAGIKFNIARSIYRNGNWSIVFNSKEDMILAKLILKDYIVEDGK